MAIPRAREVVPPPLPPPRYVEDLRSGQDPAWPWGGIPVSPSIDTGSAGNRLATVRPGSSLYGIKSSSQALEPSGSIPFTNGGIMARAKSGKEEEWTSFGRQLPYLVTSEAAAESSGQKPKAQLTPEHGIIPEIHSPRPQPSAGQSMTSKHMDQQTYQRLLQQQRLNQNNASLGVNQLQQLAIQKATQYMQQHGIPQGQNPQHYQQTLARQFFSQLKQSQLATQQAQQQQIMQKSSQPSQQGINPYTMNLAQLLQHHQTRKMQLLQEYGQRIPQQEMVRLTQLEEAIQSRQQADQQSLMQLSEAQSHSSLRHRTKRKHIRSDDATKRPGNPKRLLESTMQEASLSKRPYRRFMYTVSEDNTTSRIVQSRLQVLKSKAC